MLITSSAIPYEKLRSEQIAVVKLAESGSQWKGPHPPSSEWRMHLGILTGRPDVTAAVHADSAAFVGALVAQFSFPSPALLFHYARLYGTRAFSLLEGADTIAELGRHSEPCSTSARPIF